MIGDSPDMLARLKSLVPSGWFSWSLAPIRDVVFGGLADTLAKSYSLLSSVKAQTRIATASGWFLDLIAWDYFGARFVRRSGESDASFKPRVIEEILRPRQTRAAIIEALVDLTGRTPLIFEPWNPQDCGGYGLSVMGYGMAGCYGSLALNDQIFVTALRPAGLGIPNVGAYGEGPSGYGVAGEYVDESQVTGPVTDADIYATVAATVAAGVTGWTDIVSSLPVVPGSTLITSDNATIDSDTAIFTSDAW
jgi:hypothetical protein